MATIVKRGDTYRIQVCIGETTDGKKKFKSMTYKPPADLKSDRKIKAAVERAAQEFEDKVRDGAVINKKIRFAEIYEKWFAQITLENNLHATTLDRYNICKPKIIDTFGAMYIGDIKKIHVQDFINKVAQTGLSTKSQGLYLTVISDVFRYAVDNEICEKNPCLGVHKINKPVKEREVYTVDEVKQFLTLLEYAPIEMKAFFLLIIFTGCRYGEIMGLHWSDIDFSNGLLHINRTLTSVAKIGMVESPTKTKKSMRVIALNDLTLAVLQQYKDDWQISANSIGDLYTGTDALFINFDNNCKYWGENYARTWIKRYCEQNNLRYISIHSFRHFAASLLIANGYDVRTVSAMLGHSNTTTTLNTYAHAFNEQLAKASNSISNALLGSD